MNVTFFENTPFQSLWVPLQLLWPLLLLLMYH